MSALRTPLVPVSHHKPGQDREALVSLPLQRFSVSLCGRSVRVCFCGLTSVDSEEQQYTKQGEVIEHEIGVLRKGYVLFSFLGIWW